MRYLLTPLFLVVSAPSLAQEPSPEASVPVEKPEAEKPEAEKPEAEKPEAEKPEAEKPEAEKPEAEKPEAEKPEAEKPEAPSADQIEATTESVSLLVDALQSKNWALAIGILLSLLVSFANRLGLKDKVGGKALPWVTSAVAVLGAIGAALMAGVSIMEAASQGLVAGVAAIGGWEMVLKHILAPKSVSAAAEE